MRRSFALFVGFLVACGSDGGSDGANGDTPPPAGPLTCGPYEIAIDGACAAIGFATCPDGFAKNADGTSCTETLIACKPNEAPVLGGTCTRVGAPACPSGFVADPSTLGCTPQAPTAVCTGATREDFGGCTPIGDCNAAFPPAAATIFVSAGGPSDATHFTTIGAALTAAPANATIAIDSGTYAEGLAFTKAVTLVGRCAAQVTLQGSAAAVAGLRVATTTGITVRGVRVTGFEPGVDVDGGGSIDIADSLIDANRRQGVQVLDPKSHLGITRSAIRGSLPDATAKFGVGAGAGAGADLVLGETAIADNREMGVFATGAGTKATLSRVRVTTTHPRSAGLSGIALSLQSGAHADATESAFEASTSAGVNVVASTIALKNSTISGVTAGSGIALAIGAEAVIEGSLVTGADGVGASVNASKLTMSTSGIAFTGPNAGGVDARSKATVTLTSVGVDGARGFGIAARDASTLDATTTLVSGTRDNDGVAYAVVAYTAGVMTGHGLVVSDTTGTALVTLGPGSKMSLERSVVDRTQLTPRGSLGVAALVEKQGELALTSSVLRGTDALGIVIRASKLTMTGSVVRDTKSQHDGLSGLGLVVMDDSTATVDQSAFENNALSGILVASAKSKLTATSIAILHTQIDDTVSSGRGITVQDDATLEVSRAAILDNGQAALGSFIGTTTAMSNSILEASRKANGKWGHGAFCVGCRMDLDGVMVRKQAAIGIVYADGTGIIERTTIADNAVGLHIQGGSTLVTSATPDEPSEGEVLVTDDSLFIGNETRLGDGEVPLPQPLLTPQ